MTTEKILVVDDEQNLLEEMKEFFSMEGYQVSVAETGEKALEIFKEANPDIVFMDIKMPGMDGIETFRYMKKGKPDLKVVLITGLPDEKTLERAVGVSKDAIEGFIPKPFGFSELRACLDKLKKGAKSSSFKFTKSQLDALNKVGKSGSENASLSFSELLGEKIKLSMQQVSITPLSQSAKNIKKDTKPMVAITHKLSGEVCGKLTVLFPWKSALNLVRLGLKDYFDDKQNELNEGEEALLKSAGAVMANAYLKTAKQLLGLKIQASPSQLVFEHKESMLENLSEKLNKTAEYIFSIQTDFLIADQDISGCFLLLPDMDSLKQILKKLGALK